MRLLPVEAVVTFQSTSPVRGTTLTWDHWKEFMGISIHVPREGDDTYAYGQIGRFGDFNPRPP